MMITGAPLRTTVTLHFPINELFPAGNQRFVAARNAAGDGIGEVVQWDIPTCERAQRGEVQDHGTVDIDFLVTVS